MNGIRGVARGGGIWAAPPLSDFRGKREPRGAGHEMREDDENDTI